MRAMTEPLWSHFLDLYSITKEDFWPDGRKFSFLVNFCRLQKLPKAITKTLEERSTEFQNRISDYLRDCGWMPGDCTSAQANGRRSQDINSHMELLARWNTLDTASRFHECVKLTASGSPLFTDPCKIVSFAAISCTTDFAFRSICTGTKRNEILLELVGTSIARARAGAYLLKSLAQYESAAVTDKPLLEFFTTSNIERSVGIMIMFFQSADRTQKRRGRPRDLAALQRDMAICDVVASQPPGIPYRMLTQAVKARLQARMKTPITEPIVAKAISRLRPDLKRRNQAKS